MAAAVRAVVARVAHARAVGPVARAVAGAVAHDGRAHELARVGVRAIAQHALRRAAAVLALLAAVAHAADALAHERVAAAAALLDVAVGLARVVAGHAAAVGQRAVRGQQARLVQAAVAEGQNVRQRAPAELDGLRRRKTARKRETRARAGPPPRALGNGRGEGKGRKTRGGGAGRTGQTHSARFQSQVLLPAQGSPQGLTNVPQSRPLKKRVQTQVPSRRLQVPCARSMQFEGQPVSGSEQSTPALPCTACKERQGRGSRGR